MGYKIDADKAAKYVPKPTTTEPEGESENKSLLGQTTDLFRGLPGGIYNLGKGVVETVKKGSTLNPNLYIDVYNRATGSDDPMKSPLGKVISAVEDAGAAGEDKWDAGYGKFQEELPFLSGVVSGVGNTARNIPAYGVATLARPLEMVGADGVSNDLSEWYGNNSQYLGIPESYALKSLDDIKYRPVATLVNDIGNIAMVAGVGAAGAGAVGGRAATAAIAEQTAVKTAASAAIKGLSQDAALIEQAAATASRAAIADTLASATQKAAGFGDDLAKSSGSSVAKGLAEEATSKIAAINEQIAGHNATIAAADAAIAATEKSFSLVAQTSLKNVSQMLNKVDPFDATFRALGKAISVIPPTSRVGALIAVTEERFVKFATEAKARAATRKMVYDQVVEGANEQRKFLPEGKILADLEKQADKLIKTHVKDSGADVPIRTNIVFGLHANGFLEALNEFSPAIIEMLRKGGKEAQDLVNVLFVAGRAGTGQMPTLAEVLYGVDMLKGSHPDVLALADQAKVAATRIGELLQARHIEGKGQANPITPEEQARRASEDFGYDPRKSVMEGTREYKNFIENADEMVKVALDTYDTWKNAEYEAEFKQLSAQEQLASLKGMKELAQSAFAKTRDRLRRLTVEAGRKSENAGRLVQELSDAYVAAEAEFKNHIDSIDRITEQIAREAAAGVDVAGRVQVTAQQIDAAQTAAVELTYLKQQHFDEVKALEGRLAQVEADIESANLRVEDRQAALDEFNTNQAAAAATPSPAATLDVAQPAAPVATRSPVPPGLERVSLLSPSAYYEPELADYVVTLDDLGEAKNYVQKKLSRMDPSDPAYNDFATRLQKIDEEIAKGGPQGHEDVAPFDGSMIRILRVDDLQQQAEKFLDTRSQMHAHLEDYDKGIPLDDIDKRLIYDYKEYLNSLRNLKEARRKLNVEQLADDPTTPINKNDLTIESIDNILDNDPMFQMLTRGVKRDANFWESVDLQVAKLRAHANSYTPGDMLSAAELDALVAKLDALSAQIKERATDAKNGFSADEAVIIQHPDVLAADRRIQVVRLTIFDDVFKARLGLEVAGDVGPDFVRKGLIALTDDMYHAIDYVHHFEADLSVEKERYDKAIEEHGTGIEAYTPDAPKAVDVPVSDLSAQELAVKLEEARAAIDEEKMFLDNQTKAYETALERGESDSTMARMKKGLDEQQGYYDEAVANADMLSKQLDAANMVVDTPATKPAKPPRGLATAKKLAKKAEKEKLRIEKELQAAKEQYHRTFAEHNRAMKTLEEQGGESAKRALVDLHEQALRSHATIDVLERQAEQLRTHLPVAENDLAQLRLQVEDAKVKKAAIDAAKIGNETADLTPVEKARRQNVERGRQQKIAERGDYVSPVDGTFAPPRRGLTPEESMAGKTRLTPKETYLDAKDAYERADTARKEAIDEELALRDTILEAQESLEKIRRNLVLTKDSLDQAVEFRESATLHFDNVVANAPLQYRPLLGAFDRLHTYLTEQGKAAGIDDATKANLDAMIAESAISLSKIVNAGIDPAYMMDGVFTKMDRKLVRSDNLDLTRASTLPEKAVRKNVKDEPMMLGAEQQLVTVLKDITNANRNLTAQKLLDSFGITAATSNTEVLAHGFVTGDMTRGFSTDGLDGPQLVEKMKEIGYEPIDVTSNDRHFRASPANVTRETVFLPSAMVTELGKQFFQMKDGNLAKALEVYDSLTKGWKTSVLAYSPRWIVGNVIANSLMLTVGGGVNPLKSVDYFKKARALKELVDNDAAPSEVYQLLNAGFHHFEGTDFIDQISSRSRLGEANFKAKEFMYGLNTKTDDMTRLMYYVSQAEKGVAPELIVQQGLKVFGDYHSMSVIEREVLSRVFPFYPWMRNITRSWFYIAKEHPMRLLWLAYIGKDGETDRFGRPLIGGLVFPMAQWNPYDTVTGGNSTLNPSTIFGSANPLLKAGSILATGKEFGGGDPYLPPGTQDGLGTRLDIIGQQLRTLTPQVRILSANGEKVYSTGDPRLEGGEIAMKPRAEVFGQTLPYKAQEIIRFAGIPYPEPYDAVGAQNNKDYQLSQEKMRQRYESKVASARNNQ